MLTQLFIFYTLLSIVRTKDDFKIVCYSQVWNIETYSRPFEREPAEQCTHMIYAFAHINETFDVAHKSEVLDIDRNAFDKFVNLKNYNPQLKVLLGISGYNGNGSYFSQMVASSDKREKFVGDVIRFINGTAHVPPTKKTHYQFDGIDIYWPDANRTHNDCANLVLLLKQLRPAFDRLNLMLTISAGMQYKGIMYEVYDIINLTDHVHVVGYDLRDLQISEGKVDVHSPLDKRDFDQDPDLQSRNVAGGLMFWSKPGVDKRKLILGVPFFGKSYTLNDRQSHDLNSNAFAEGHPGEISSIPGYLTYFEILDRLQNRGWKRGFDIEGKCPYAYKDNQWVGYEDEESLKYKMNLIKSGGYGGVMIKSLDDDDEKGKFGEKRPLFNVIQCELRGISCKTKHFQPLRTTVIAMIAISVVAAVGIMIGMVLVCVKRNRKPQIRTQNSHQSTGIDSMNRQSVPNLYNGVRQPRFAYSCDNAIVEELKAEGKLLSYEDITLGEELGEGHFGCVYRATLSTSHTIDAHLTVAVKTLRQQIVVSPTDVNMFLKEALVMKDFDHPNVLGLVGLCFDSTTPFVILPYMKNGSLFDYLKNVDNNITGGGLIKYATDVAKGMEYLSQQKFIHRDLAARNCMLDDHLVVKVADFGLARDVYAKGFYIPSENNEIPIKWMAPESFCRNSYTTKSDVWSYGVVVWEIMTRCGYVPYGALTNAVNLFEFLREGGRLERPTTCPPQVNDAIYDIMKKCWSWDPEKRPSFTQILSLLEQTEKRLKNVSSQEKVPKKASYINVMDVMRRK